MSTSLPVIGALVFVLCILNAVFLGVIFFMRRRMAAVSLWPSTMGTVMTSTVEERSDGDGGSAGYPVVRYSYRINGQGYQSVKRAPGPEVGGSGAGKIVARYPAGTQVMVFYNPENPFDAVLERKAPAQWLMWFLLVLFDCILCVSIVPLVWFSIGR